MRRGVRLAEQGRPTIFGDGRTMKQIILDRRDVLNGAAAATMAVLPAGVVAVAHAGPALGPARMISAADFGAVGDGSKDDTAALQKALDETFGNGSGFLLIPPGTYRISRTLRILP